METILYSNTKKNLFLLLFLSVIVFTNSIFSESIRLTSGIVLDGTIVSESDKVIVFQTKKGTFTIKKTDILEMERPDSKEIIVKPAEEKYTLGKLISMSFIPGYSPIYKSKERPEFGLPFAMLSLNYFYKFLQFQTNSRAVGFMNSVEMKDSEAKIMNFTVGPRWVAGATGDIVYSPDGGAKFDIGSNLYQYINFRSVFYNRSPDRIVMGVTMREDEYINTRRNHLVNFLAVSVANMIVSYIILNGEGGLGTAKLEHNGIKTIFYAFPTPDGGSFGTVSRF